MRKAKWISVILLSVVILFVILSSLSERDSCRPYHYLIPNGYVGWIQVIYKVKDAMPLQTDEKGFYILKIPQSGILKTSSSMQICFTEVKFGYINQNGNIKELNCWGDPDNNNKDMMVWDESYEHYGPYVENEKYFIGNREQFQNARQ